MKRALSAAALMGACLAGCPDTTVPELGVGRGGRVCTAEMVSAFQQASTADERTDLWVAFIDVGQGDSTWIRTPGLLNVNAKEIVVDSGDAGGRPPRDFAPDGAQAVTDFMQLSGWGPGNRIDYLVTTHPDIDHYGGGEALLKAYQVGAYVDPGKESPDSSTYVRLLETARAEPGLTMLRPAVVTGLDPASPGLLRTTTWGRGVEVSVLSGDPAASTDNGASLILMVEYRGVRILLMGDAEESLDENLIASGQRLEANVLKAGHHGGQGTNSQALLDRVFPTDDGRRFVIVSSGRRENLPDPEVFQRLLQAVGADGLYQTDRGDVGKSQMAAPGDDHILLRVTEDGEMTVCYAFPD